MNFILQSLNRNLKGFKRSLRGGSVFLFGGLLLSNAIAFGYLMVLARLMSPEEYGILVTLTSISYVLTVVMRTIQAWVMKTISTNRNIVNGHLQSMFIIGMRPLLPLGVLLVVGNLFLGSWLASFIHISNVTPIIMMSFYIFSSFLVPVVRGILLGLNRIYSASLVSILEPLGRLLAGVALVNLGFSVNGAITGYTVGNLLAFAIGFITLWSLILRPRDKAFPKFRLDGLTRYAVLVFFINVCLMILMSIDQITVTHYFSDQIAGNYAIAFLVGRVISMSTVALGWVVFTRSTAMTPNEPGHVRVLVKALALTGIISVVVMGACLVAPNLVVQLMGGNKFHIADDYLTLVTIEMTLFAFINVQVYFHISRNRTEAIWPLILSVAILIFLLAQYHTTVLQILFILISVMGGLLVSISGLTFWILHSQKSFKPTMVSESSPVGTDQ